MDRAIRPGLLIFGCSALLITAVLLPVLILRPANRVEPVRLTPVGQTRVVETLPRQTPATRTPATQAPVTQTPASKAPPAQAPAFQSPLSSAMEEGDGLSRGQRFRIVEQEAFKTLGPGAALSSALAKAFTFPHARDDAVFGIDVSHHNTSNCQCKIDWDRVAAQKVAFVFAKATEGVSFRDKTFDDHWRALAKHPKIHRGAYHFLRADADIETQAKIFLAKMGKLMPGDLPPVMDLEWDTYRDSTRKWQPRERGDYWSNLEPDEILERALKWLTIVEKETGRVPIVYTSRTWWVERIKDESKLERLKRYPIWLSAMEDEDLRLEKPGSKGRWAGKWNWTLWQFTNKGDLTNAGIKNPSDPRAERFDVNIFPGQLAQFQQTMGISASLEIVRNDTAKPPAPSGPSPGGGSAGSGPVPPKEPEKQAQASGTQVADSTTVAPKETPKDQVAGTPLPDAGAGTPKEPPKDQTGTSDRADSGTVPPKEPPKEPPKDQTAGTPAPDTSTAAPKEPPKDQTASTPTPDTGSVTPKETPKDQVAGTPGPDTGTVVPSEPPKDQMAGAPGPDSGTAPSTEPLKDQSGGTATPKEPQKETQVAALPVPDSGGKLGDSSIAKVPDGGGNTESASKAPATTTAQKITVEILLKNGRILRVDSSIDPSILTRLVELLEK